MPYMRKKNVSELKLNSEIDRIYGIDDISDLKEKIKTSGTVTILSITKDGTVWSGNRRLRACRELADEGYSKFSVLDCEVVSFKSPIEEKEFIIKENSSRTKTAEQKAREAREMLIVERAKQDSGDDPYNSDSKILRMSSGSAVKRAVQTVNCIDELVRAGRERDVELIRSVLNELSYRSAAEFSSHIDDLTEEEKQLIRDKKLSTKKAANKYAVKKNIKPQKKSDIKVTAKQTADEYLNLSKGLIKLPDLFVADQTDNYISCLTSSVNFLLTAVANIENSQWDFSFEQKKSILSVLNDAENKISNLQKMMEV